jgi:sugar (pentulose or hexulose) kinase
VTYDDLNLLAKTTKPFRTIINPADPRFTAPGEMTSRIIDYCREHNVAEPMSIGEHIRCIYDSLSLSYLFGLEQLESITGKHYNEINVIGGGSRNNFLNQLTADVTRRKIIAGPVEAAALGNSIMQYKCIGFLKDIKEARVILKETLELREFYPEDGIEWEDSYDRYLELIKA